MWVRRWMPKGKRTSEPGPVADERAGASHQLILFGIKFNLSEFVLFEEVIPKTSQIIGGKWGSEYPDMPTPPRAFPIGRDTFPIQLVRHLQQVLPLIFTICVENHLRANTVFIQQVSSQGDVTLQVTFEDAGVQGSFDADIAPIWILKRIAVSTGNEGSGKAC